MTEAAAAGTRQTVTRRRPLTCGSGEGGCKGGSEVRAAAAAEMARGESGEGG